ncbi:MAG: YqjF family protein [Halolamina sp.]
MERRLLEMSWCDALFAHWPVAPETVAETLPEGVSVATYDGDAWLGIVAFVMEDIRPRGVPVGLTFGEANLRTYVTGPDGTDGIYFYNLDAEDPLGVYVARGVYDLPYYRAEMSVERRSNGDGDGDGNGNRGFDDPDGGTVRFLSNRTHPGVPAAHLDCTYGPTSDPRQPEPGSLESFLVENYRFYTEGGDGLYYGDVAHEPWPLCDADCDLRSTTFFEANGFDAPDGDPLVHYSPGVDVGADRIRRLAR